MRGQTFVHVLKLKALPSYVFIVIYFIFQGVAKMYSIKEIIRCSIVLHVNGDKSHFQLRYDVTFKENCW